MDNKSQKYFSNSETSQHSQYIREKLVIEDDKCKLEIFYYDSCNGRS